MNKANLLWVDLEMTGLDPSRDRILEVGAIATDWDFTEFGHYESVVKVDPKLLKTRMTGEFWDKNATVRQTLMKQNSESQKTAADVETEILKFIADNFDANQPIYLAGNSIHQDRKFIEREWPKLNARLHYRMLDVSAWKLVFENKFGKKFHKPEAHRAMSDIAGSIAELKQYLKKVKI